MIKEIIASMASKFELDPAIVYGVCKQENRDFNPCAVRFESGSTILFNPREVKPVNCSLRTEIELQHMSFGLMQVMGFTARELGHRGWLTALISNVTLQLDLGCKYLKRKILNYGLEQGVASYNSGAPRFIESGELANQAYVDAVIGYSKEWET